jgi:competence protein ComEC
MLLTLFLMFANWYYFPSDSPSTPVKIENVDLNLKENELAMTFFSLTDGEATLIQHPNGETVLINSGGTKTKAELKNLLELYGIDKISKVVLTNQHQSNIENLNWILENYHVSECYSNESTSSVIKSLMKPDVAVSQLIWDENTNEEILPGLKIEVLNDEDGIDLSVEFLSHRILLLNPVNQTTEKQLLAKQFAKTKIVQFRGYGDEQQISDELINHLDPQVAVFFQKENNKPDQELFQRLAEAWVDVYFAKRHGTITIKFTDNNYEVLTISNEEK